MPIDVVPTIEELIGVDRELFLLRRNIVAGHLERAAEHADNIARNLRAYTKEGQHGR